MKNFKYSDILLWGAALVSLILTIVTAIFGFTSESAFSKVILILVSILFLLLCAMVAYLAYLNTFEGGFSLSFFKMGEADKPNYFLNPNGKRKGITPEELTFELVNDRVTAFIVDTFGGIGAMWKNEIFAEEDCFGKKGEFKTLVAYKMLYDLQIHHSKKVWGLFFELPEAEFEDICKCLSFNGDEELAEQLKGIKENGAGNLREAAAFLDNNGEYIKRRMVNYVKRKSELFDM